LTATCPSVVENEPALDTGCVPGRANEVGLDHHVVAAPFSEAETLESCPLAGIGFFRIRSTQRFVVPTNKDTGHNRLPRALLAGVGRAFACAVTFTVTISPQAGSTPASVILTDATQALPTATGQLGSGLGYIGIANGYLGIGVDTYGGYNGRRAPENISLRGATSTGSQSIGGTEASARTRSIRLRQQGRPAGVHVIASVTCARTISVSVDGTTKLSLASFGSAQPAFPAKVFVGFAASSGGSTDYHQIANVTITANP
jgi:hypothetical protein